MHFLSSLWARLSQASAPQDCLKLDNDFSMDAGRLLIGTVLYDRTTDPVRASSPLSRLFGWIKEQRAAAWAERFIRTALPAGEDRQHMLAHIRSTGRVTRTELLDLLVKKRLEGWDPNKQPTPTLEGRLDNFYIRDVEKAIHIHFKRTLNISDPELHAFMQCLNSGFRSVPPALSDNAYSFIQKFGEAAAITPKSPLVSLLQGRVNLMQRAMQDQFRLSLGAQELLDRIEVNERGEPIQSLAAQRLPGFHDFFHYLQGFISDKGVVSDAPYELSQVAVYCQAYRRADKAGAINDAIWSRYVADVEQGLSRDASFELLSGRIHAALIHAQGRHSNWDGVVAFCQYCRRGAAGISSSNISKLQSLKLTEAEQFFSQRSENLPTPLGSLADRQASLEPFETQAIVAMFNQLQLDLQVYTQALI